MGLEILSGRSHVWLIVTVLLSEQGEESDKGRVRDVRAVFFYFDPENAVWSVTQNVKFLCVCVRVYLYMCACMWALHLHICVCVCVYLRELCACVPICVCVRACISMNE